MLLRRSDLTQESRCKIGSIELGVKYVKDIKCHKIVCSPVVIFSPHELGLCVSLSLKVDINMRSASSPNGFVFVFPTPKEWLFWFSH